MKFLMRLAQDKTIEDIFGGGVKDAPLGTGSVGENFTNIFGFAIKIVFVAAAFFTLAYLLWGVIDYIVSAGEPDKMAKARQKMINAIVGILILAASLTIWLVVVVNILGIFGGSDGNFDFKLPTLRDVVVSPTPGGGTPLIQCPAGGCIDINKTCPSGTTSVGDHNTTTCPNIGAGTQCCK